MRVRVGRQRQERVPNQPRRRVVRLEQEADPVGDDRLRLCPSAVPRLPREERQERIDRLIPDGGCEGVERRQ